MGLFRRKSKDASIEVHSQTDHEFAVAKQKLLDDSWEG